MSTQSLTILDKLIYITSLCRNFGKTILVKSYICRYGRVGLMHLSTKQAYESIVRSNRTICAKGAKDMELCDSCKKTLCEKNMEITRQGNLITIRCLDYEKDSSKIQGYKKQLNRTARQHDALMKLNI